MYSILQRQADLEREQSAQWNWLAAHDAFLRSQQRFDDYIRNKSSIDISVPTGTNITVNWRE
jgi:hypothetical protein